MKVAVIGAGPAGLVTLRYLSTAHHYFPIDPIEVICIEAEGDLGGTFKYRVYEDAEVSRRPSNHLHAQILFNQSTIAPTSY